MLGKIFSFISLLFSGIIILILFRSDPVDDYRRIFNLITNFSFQSDESEKYSVNVGWELGTRPVEEFSFRTEFSGEVRLSSLQTPEAEPVRFAFDYPFEFEAALWANTLVQDTFPPHVHVDPDVSSIIFPGCLFMSKGTVFGTNIRMDMEVDHYYACRMHAEDGAEDTAVIGVIWPSGRNKPPLRDLTERCALESMVWLEHVANPEDDIVICLVVSNVDDQAADVVIFERSGDRLLLLRDSEFRDARSWKIVTGKGNDRNIIKRYDLLRSLERSEVQISDLSDQAINEIRLKTDDFWMRLPIEFSEVRLEDGHIVFELISTNDDQIERELAQANRRADYWGGVLYSGLSSLICHGDILPAMLDFQYAEPVFRYLLLDSDGNGWVEGTIGTRRCPFRDFITYR